MMIQTVDNRSKDDPYGHVNRAYPFNLHAFCDMAAKRGTSIQQRLETLKKQTRIRADVILRQEALYIDFDLSI